MRILALLFLLISGAGFLASLTVHVRALFGHTAPGCVWLLHLLIFATAIPAMWLGNRKFGDVPKKDQWDVMMAYCPSWIRRAVSVVGVYTVINFAWFFISTVGQPKVVGPAPPSVVRGFSGHWMLFYSVGFAMWYAIFAKPRLPDRHNANDDFHVDRHLK